MQRAVYFSSLHIRIVVYFGRKKMYILLRRMLRTSQTTHIGSVDKMWGNEILRVLPRQ